MSELENSIERPLISEQVNNGIVLVEESISHNTAVVSKSKESTWQWLKRQQLKIVLGSIAASTALGFTSEFDKFEHQITTSGPWLGSVYVGSEVAWWSSAALMLANAGSKIGNPLKIRGRTNEIIEKAVDSKIFRASFAANIAASMAITGVGIDAAIQAPPETLGYLTFPAWNVGTDLMFINMVRNGIKKNKAAKQKKELTNYEIQDTIEPSQESSKKQTQESEKKPKIGVRQATPADVERMTDIDLARYKRIYGEDPRFSRKFIKNMYERCIENAGPGWTYVCEVDGVVEGLVNGFRTNKSIDDFVSWEDCTADGSLDGKVDPGGRYVYGANLTVNPKATKYGGEDMLVANLFAQLIHEGVEYGYFIGRMPLFSAWVKRQTRQGAIGSELTPERIDELAEQYVNSKELVDGKEARIDPELRMYEELGFEINRIVREGYQDPLSLNYGVLFRAEVPPKGILKKSKPARLALAKSIRFMAKHPKLLEKALS